MSKARNLFLFTTGALIFVLLLTGLALLAKDQEDEHRWLGRERRHRAAHIGGDDEGNEAAGQIAVWLMVAANLPVAVSILVKWTSKSIPAASGLKPVLARFNRLQRRHLMRLHYLVNPLVLVVALWHWLTSRCRTTVLPTAA